MYKKLIIAIVIVIGFTSCSKQPNLSDNELFSHSLKCFDKIENMTSINIPSRGIIADGLALSTFKITGADGGFYKDFKNSINNGITQFSIYSDNNLKASQYLIGTLKKFKDNELNNISICYIGDQEYSNGIEIEVIRVGAKYTNIFQLNSQNGSNIGLGIIPTKANNGGIMDTIKNISNDKSDNKNINLNVK